MCVCVCVCVCEYFKYNSTFKFYKYIVGNNNNN